MREEYQDIAPYDDSEFASRIHSLADEPGLHHALKYVMPEEKIGPLLQQLKRLKTQEEFQMGVILPFLESLEKGTTAGVTSSGMETLTKEHSALIITNHRDIVLDACFLGLERIRHGLPSQEVALGDNLLIFDWIETLVRLNKGIIVKRNLRFTKALEAAKQLSGYIRYCVDEKHESVWLAQREGRAKDSNDLTQESVIKMLALSGDEPTVARRLLPLNIQPTTVSYEYDPNDYLKASEFLSRRRDPEFRKSQRDDLYSMETGILRFKGRVHFSVGHCINPELELMADDTDKVSVVRRVCALIDREIHLGYKIFPVNYIAYDQINHTDRFADRYTPEEAASFMQYLHGQLTKVDLPDVTSDERQFMLEAMLQMYANPLVNHLAAAEQLTSEIH